MGMIDPRAVLHQGLYSNMEEAYAGFFSFQDELVRSGMQISGRIIVTIASYELNEELKGKP